MTHTCPGCNQRRHPARYLTNCRYDWGKAPADVERSNAERVAEILARLEAVQAEAEELRRERNLLAMENKNITADLVDLRLRVAVARRQGWKDQADLRVWPPVGR